MGEDTLSLQELHTLADDLARQRTLFKTINDFALKLLTIPSTEELVWYVAREVVGRMGFDDCVIYLIDQDRRLLRQSAAIGIKNPHANQIINALEIPIGDGITGTVAQTKQAMVVADLSKDPRYIPDVEPALSEICVPLIIDDTVVGVIDCEDPKANQYGDEHLEILTTIAAMTSAKLKLINEAKEAGTRSEELARLNAELTEQIAVRERAEQALKKSRAQLLSIMNNSPALISIKDLDSRYTYVNPSYCRYFQTTPEQAIGQTADGILADDIAAGIRVGDDAIASAGNRSPIGEPFPVKFGDSTLLLTKFPICDEDGNLLNIGTIGIDISEQKQAEESLRQAQKMEAVGQLTGGVAHDFNNLLAVILGNAELLADNRDPMDPRVQAVIRSAERGSELTQRLLAYSRQQPLINRSADLAKLVHSLHDLLQRTLGETIVIETRAQPGLWRALVDTGQVENAILNLAINARDAMPHGGRLTIACENTYLDDVFVADNPETAPGEYVSLSVIDTGMGIPPDVQTRVFEPFFTTKEVGQGSGLGLSMVYGFAKQSRGHVAITSAEGQGTTVRLYLPRALCAPAASLSQSDDLPRGNGQSILVIEDDDDVRDLAVHLIEGLGYSVVAVPTAAEAREAFRAHRHFDLLLSDVVLPGGTSGPEFAGEIRATAPETKILFMSGYPDGQHGTADLSVADARLLTKPFLRHELAAVLSKVLEADQ